MHDLGRPFCCSPCRRGCQFFDGISRRFRRWRWQSAHRPEAGEVPAALLNKFSGRHRGMDRLRDRMAFRFRIGLTQPPLCCPLHRQEDQEGIDLHSSRLCDVVSSQDIRSQIGLPISGLRGLFTDRADLIYKEG